MAHAHPQHADQTLLRVQAAGSTFGERVLPLLGRLNSVHAFCQLAAGRMRRAAAAAAVAAASPCCRVPPWSLMPGHSFRVTTFGESHGGGVGCVIDGVPPRLHITQARPALLLLCCPPPCRPHDCPLAAKSM